MITSDFRSAIDEKDTMLVRIMLKDALILDPTLREFDEMFQYAKERLPDLLVPYDGDSLETDPQMWDKKILNRELMNLINNFSTERIRYLKKLVPTIYPPQRSQQRDKQCHISRETKHTTSHRYKDEPQLADGIKRFSITQLKSLMSISRLGKSAESPSSYTHFPASQAKPRVQTFLEEIDPYFSRIKRIHDEIHSRRQITWNDIDDMEQAVKKLSQAIRSYKENQ